MKLSIKFCVASLELDGHCDYAGDVIACAGKKEEGKEGACGWDIKKVLNTQSVVEKD